MNKFYQKVIGKLIVYDALETPIWEELEDDGEIDVCTKRHELLTLID